MKTADRGSSSPGQLPKFFSVHQDEALERAPFDRPGSGHDAEDAVVPSDGTPSDATRPSPAVPRTRVRPLTRRAHVRVPGATAARLERLAFRARGSEATDGQPLATAISVVPGSSLPVVLATPMGADLDELLGDEESGCAPGRHRRPSVLWTLLRFLPGCRSSAPATWDDADDSPEVGGFGSGEAPKPASHEHGDDTDGSTEGLSRADTDGTQPADLQAGDSDHTDHTDADHTEALVPSQRTEPQEPVYQRRRRRSPSPSARTALQVAARHIEEAPDPTAIARVACEEAAHLVDADVTALVLRAVEGPRVLWLHPGGPEADGLWGPATLAALLKVGHPVRRVVEGDPLADGAATALLTVPVPSGGFLAGTLLARRHQDRIFSAGEQDVLSRLARMAGAALRAASRPGAHGTQDDDPATGLPLGRRFTIDVEAALRTAQRQDLPVSVVAAHVDGLARIRTELGEQIAEDVIRELATHLRRALRVGDLAYRIGPDELALLLPATDAEGVPSVRERAEAVAAEVFDGLSFPGPRRLLALRTAPVPADEIIPGRSVVDVVLKALELDRQKVRWSPPTR